MKLSEIQSRLADVLGLRLTYMEVKMLVSDLQVLPKDQPETKPPAPLPVPPKAPADTASQPKLAPMPEAEEAVADAPVSRVSVTADEIARPGTIVSGSVTFSDGEKAGWYLDQMGRLGLMPKKQGYRPNAADVQEFQASLEQILARMGM